MTSNRKTVLIWIVPPLLIVALHFLVYPRIGVELKASLIEWTTLYGFLLGYFGFAFSAYAAVGVRELHDRYVGNTRLPKLHSALVENASNLASHAASKGEELKGTNVVPSLAANIRAIGSHAPNTVKKAVKDATKSVDAFKVSLMHSNAGITVNEISGFWEAHMAAHQLATELDNAIKDERTRQNV